MEPTKKNTKEYAQQKDKGSPLAHRRMEFIFPSNEKGEESIYLAGNSLGLQAKNTSAFMNAELSAWQKHAVEGHWKADKPWLSYHTLFPEKISKLIGAYPDEVVVMNSLSVNLHLLFASFYHPKKDGRYKILMEAGAFPSDQYIVETQVKMHGLDPADAIIEIAPHEGCYTINDEDITSAIRHHGDTLALVLIGGVNYYSGQLFDIEHITAVAHSVDAYAGFDLAHAIGNIPLDLHAWKVDFAAWCSYKYLNSGPGGIAGIYVHEDHCKNKDLPQLGAWWGTKEETRFNMKKGFVPTRTAERWQLSNPSIFSMVPLLASLEIFDATTIYALRAKSKALTGYLEELLTDCDHLPFQIITPKQIHRRGCQLSLLFHDRATEVYTYLHECNIITDLRKPNVIRMAPTPLYNSFMDIYTVYEALKELK